MESGQTIDSVAECSQGASRLASMLPGQSGQVIGFESGNRGYRRKLLALGLTRGVEFQVLCVAPLGDPVEIRVRGFDLSLRRAEANVLKIHPR